MLQRANISISKWRHSIKLDVSLMFSIGSSPFTLRSMTASRRKQNKTYKKQTTTSVAVVILSGSVKLRIFPAFLHLCIGFLAVVYGMSLQSVVGLLSMLFYKEWWPWWWSDYEDEDHNDDKVHITAAAGRDRSQLETVLTSSFLLLFPAECAMMSTSLLQQGWQPWHMWAWDASQQ